MKQHDGTTVAVVLSVAKVDRHRAEYYLATVPLGRGEAGRLVDADGAWLGRAAAALGLDGAVTPDALRAVFSGTDPRDESALVAADRRRVAAFDCTFSSPKSVSVLGALGDEAVVAEVRAGHGAATAGALAYLERAACVRRTGPAAVREPVAARGLVAAGFEHGASRAPDPHLHTHVLVANLAQGPDGRWSALDGRSLYLHVPAAAALYETQLRSELTVRLGVEWGPLSGAWADVAGIEPEVLRAFSRRSAAIRDELERLGRRGRRAERLVALATRPAKDLDTPYDELVAAWRERSYALGVSPGRLRALVGRRRPVPGQSADRPPASASDALGRDGPFARDGTCRRSDLVRAVCGALPQGAPVAEVERAVEGLVASGRLIELVGPARPRLSRAGGPPFPAGAREVRYTSRAVLEVHERTRALVADRPGAVRLATYERGDRLAVLDAVAATAGRNGERVAGLAPGRAAAVAFEAATGIETAPFGRRPAPGGRRLEPGRERPPCALVVVADAHRLGPWELHDAVAEAAAGRAEVVLVSPAWALRDGDAPVRALSASLDAVEAPRRQRAPNEAAEGSRPVAGERFAFAGPGGGTDVVVVGRPDEARAALVAEAVRAHASGAEAVLVVRDVASAAAVQAALADRALATDAVVARLAEAPRSAERVLVLGGADGLATSRVGRAARWHVVVAPPGSRAGDHLGLAADVARPRYLTGQLGRPPADLARRARWRVEAAAIERFRERHGVVDRRRAFGELAPPAPSALEAGRSRAAPERSLGR